MPLCRCFSGSIRCRPRTRPFSSSARPAPAKEWWRALFTAGAPARNRPLVTVDCTALPANLIESELFGREKGAFTGSDARQMGRFELADGGTLFLDEIGEMPLELQTKLLRVIQDGEFERLGSPRTIKVNVRIIAATNRTWRKRSAMAGSGKTCSTGSTFSPSRSRRSGSARKTSRCLSIFLSPNSIRK